MHHEATHTYIGKKHRESHGQVLRHGARVRIERPSLYGEHTLMVREIEDDGTLGYTYHVNEGLLRAIKEPAQ